MQEGRQIVAYFDFDGTLSDRDTLVPFLIYAVGIWRFLCCVPSLLPIVIRYGLRLINNETAKELTLQRVIAGMKSYVLEQKAKNFALTRLNKYLKPVVYSKLEWHREHGHTLVLVSANLGVYLRYWARLHKLDYVIATELDINERNRVTGCLQTRNCYGKEKVTRIKQFLADNHLSFSYSYAYGNSAGDYALFAYSNEPFYVSGDSVERWSHRNER